MEQYAVYNLKKKKIVFSVVCQRNTTLAKKKLKKKKNIKKLNEETKNLRVIYTHARPDQRCLSTEDYTWQKKRRLVGFFDLP